MADVAFKKKITKKAFETKLIEDFGYDNLVASPYNENGWDDENECPKITKLTLYYVNEAHAATWCKGEGWTFQKAYDGSLKSLKEEINELEGKDNA